MSVATSSITARLRDPDADPPAERSRLRFAAMLVTMGVAHFVVPAPFERIVPRWVRWRRGAVLWSGAAEVASGVLVAVPATRRLGGWCAFVTIAGVYPANVQMAVDATRGGSRGAMAATWARLPLQVPMLMKALSLTR
jgi:uncharacterized membrane protein